MEPFTPEAASSTLSVMGCEKLKSTPVNRSSLVFMRSTRFSR